MVTRRACQARPVRALTCATLARNVERVVMVSRAGFVPAEAFPPIRPDRCGVSVRVTLDGSLKDPPTPTTAPTRRRRRGETAGPHFRAWGRKLQAALPP